MASLFATTSASGKNLCGAGPGHKRAGEHDSATTGKIALARVLHVPLDVVAAAAVVVEAQLPQVREPPADAVARLALGDHAVAGDEVDLVARLPRAGLVAIAEPAADDRVPPAQRLAVVRVVRVRRVLAEEIRDRARVIGPPRLDVAIEPLLRRLTSRGTKKTRRPPLEEPPSRRTDPVRRRAFHLMASLFATTSASARNLCGTGSARKRCGV
jgi:hypothetical protein